MLSKKGNVSNGGQKIQMLNRLFEFRYTDIQLAISIKVAPEQSGKVEYEREKLAESDD